jgi:Uma2 family endonuclease
MATTPRPSVGRKVDYPTSDGKPMSETEAHRKLMVALIETLEVYYVADPMVHVTGNLLVFYEEGDKRKHVSPDVFVVRGVPKKERDYYLMWDEGKGPDLVIELTSKTTKSEDVKKKMALYRNVLKVPEYFLFDPFRDYLKPPMQGYRLVNETYEPITPVEGRLPSEVLGLHLERAGSKLRLYNPLTDSWLPTSDERNEADRQRAEAEHQRAEAEHQRAEVERQRVEAERERTEVERRRAEADRLRADQAEAENARLRQELEALRGQRNGGS